MKSFDQAFQDIVVSKQTDNWGEAFKATLEFSNTAGVTFDELRANTHLMDVIERLAADTLPLMLTGADPTALLMGIVLSSIQLGVKIGQEMLTGGAVS